ncbi:MAG: zinc-ribbon domain-containing protein [Thermoguttaceae bacterium]|nr:zinc-ribbon domain-containing protein [Thermoguttaceae bacterium]MDW8039293.1 hypothetical protein [Thermoguttaceae bacterium]
MRLHCPHCGAVLDEGFLAAQGAEFDCPECDQPVRLEELQAADATEQLRAGQQPSYAEQLCEAAEPISDTPPPGRLECVQKDRQLIILILPGSNRVVRSLGCMAVVWLTMIAGMSIMMIRVGMFAMGFPWEALPLVAIFAVVFWGAGLAMLYFWLLGRFGKTYVLVEPDRVVIRRVLFGRERLQEYPLGPSSRAELVESYRQNNQPVYKVSISTPSGKAASFGTFLSDEEKHWLVARINRHLGAPVRRGPPHRQTLRPSRE